MTLTALSFAAAGDGYIERYDVAININDDGSLDVTERIDYTFTDRSHGIYRIIPNRYPVTEPFTPESSETTIDESYDRVVAIEDIQVTSPSGAPTDVEESQEGSVLSLRVGDPDRTIIGAQSYVITYRVEGALNSFAEYDELYWDAIGTEWSVPIRQATVRVDAPAVDDARCFTGALGSAGRCAEPRASRSTSVQAKQDGVGNGAGVTVVVAMPKGAVDVPPPVYEQRWSLQRAFSVTPATIGAAVAALALAGAGVIWVLRRGRDRRYVGQIPGLGPDRQAVTPPRRCAPSVTPARGRWSGRLPTTCGRGCSERSSTSRRTSSTSQRRSSTSLSAGTSGSTRSPTQGLFSSRDWQLVQLKGGDTELLDYEQRLFAALFTGRNVVRLSELKRTFADDLSKVQDSLYDELVYRKWYRRRPDSTRTAWALVGFVVVAAAIGVTYLLATFTTFGIAGLALVIGAVAIFFAVRDMPARTGQGSAVLARTLGFRRYLATAEAGQIRFEEGTDVFSRYLPTPSCSVRPSAGRRSSRRWLPPGARPPRCRRSAGTPACTPSATATSVRRSPPSR